MLIYIAGKHGIYRAGCNSVQIGASRFDAPHIGSRVQFKVFAIQIHRQLFTRNDVVDEMAISRAKIQRSALRIDVTLQIPADGPPECSCPSQLLFRKTEPINTTLKVRLVRLQGLAHAAKEYGFERVVLWEKS